MKHKYIAILVGVFALLLASGTQSMSTGRDNDRGKKDFKAALGGYSEAPPKLTSANGQFKAHLSNDGDSLTWQLKYTGLSGDPTEIHIHFGQPGVNGGVILHLCGHEVPCPAGTSNTLTGTLTAEDIDGAPNQGIAEGDFDGFVEVLRAGMTYVNAATDPYPAGEIRGQIADPFMIFR